MDWTQPIETTQYLQLLTDLKNRDVDSISLCLNNPTNPITGMMKYDRARNVFQEWNGTVWTDRVLAVAGGGTGTTTGGGPYGTMAYQNANAVDITGGTIYVNNLTSSGTISSGYRIQCTGGFPSVTVSESGAPPNAKNWDMYANGNVFCLRCVDDAYSAANNFITVNRSGYIPSLLTLLTTTESAAEFRPTPDNARNLGSSTNYWLATYSNVYNARPGSLGVCAYSFTGSGNSGMWYEAQKLHLAIWGVDALVCNYSPAGVTINGDLTTTGKINVGTTIALKAGTLGACAVGFGGLGSPDSGIYYSSNNEVVIAAWGSNRILCSGPSAVVVMNANLYLPPGSLSSPSYQFSGIGQTGMYCMGSAGNSGMGFGCDGVDMLFLDKPNSLLWVGSDKHIAPRVDGAQASGWSMCGTNSFRWYIVYSFSGVSTGSDIRLKDVKGPTRLGLNFINKLNPIEYTWVTRKSKLRHGIIAQELKATLDELKVEFDGLYEPEREAGQWGLNYSELIAPIIKAIQELDDKVDVLRSEINAKKTASRQQ